MHPDITIVCGLDGCRKEYTNLKSFKSHLKIHHSNFYPDLLGEIPQISNLSVFTTSFERSQEILEISPSNEPNTIDNSPDCFSSSINIGDDSENLIENKTKEFIGILAEHGCQQNITFKALKGLSNNLISFFTGLSTSGALSQDLVYSFHSSINSSDKFDECLEKYYKATFPEVIEIASTSFSFVCFPFRSVLDNLLMNFKNFDQILLKPGTSSNINSFFSSETYIEPNTIYLNFYVDDFQLANPLLSKKSLKNSISATVLITVLETPLNFFEIKTINVIFRYTETAAVYPIHVHGGVHRIRLL